MVAAEDAEEEEEDAEDAEDSDIATRDTNLLAVQCSAATGRGEVESDRQRDKTGREREKNNLCQSRAGFSL
jgi:hypothetical protein